MKVLNFLRQLFKRLRSRKEKEMVKNRILPIPPPRPRETAFVNRPGSQITSEHYGKFMKHGRQSPWYRATVRRRKQIEEDTD